jgi:hypothetical protein
LKKIYLAAASAMTAYFLLALTYQPIYQEEANTPRPRIDVVVSSETIELGQSFNVTVWSYNEGDTADLQTVSIGFPQNSGFDGIRIVSYDFLQSPKMIQIGEDVGTQYVGNQATIPSRYPMIEAYSRPAKPGDTFHMKIEITPTQIGPFHVYAKSVAMPHSDIQSHFPTYGLLDHQDEYVLDFLVMVVSP